MTEAVVHSRFKESFSNALGDYRPSSHKRLVQCVLYIYISFYCDPCVSLRLYVVPLCEPYHLGSVFPGFNFLPIRGVFFFSLNVYFFNMQKKKEKKSLFIGVSVEDNRTWEFAMPRVHAHESNRIIPRYPK